MSSVRSSEYDENKASVSVEPKQTTSDLTAISSSLIIASFQCESKEAKETKGTIGLEETEFDINVIDPREIIIAYQKVWQKSLSTHVDEFLRNPNEMDLYFIHAKLVDKFVVKNKKNELEKWDKLIDDLRNKERSNTISSTELLLIAIDRLSGRKFSSSNSKDLSVKYLGEVIKRKPEDITYAIALFWYAILRPRNTPEKTQFLREASEKGSNFAFASSAKWCPDAHAQLLNKRDCFCYEALGKYYWQQEKFKIAYQYLAESAKYGNFSAMEKLAEMFEKGLHGRQDPQLAALFYRLSIYGKFSKLQNDRRTIKINELSNTHKEHYLFFQYQLHMLGFEFPLLRDGLATQFENNHNELLEYMSYSGDSWNETKPHLKEKTVANIEKSLNEGMEVLRRRGLNADLAILCFEYFDLPEDLTKAISKINVNRFEQEQARFQKSVRVLIANPHLSARSRQARKDARENDEWLWARPDPDKPSTANSKPRKA